MRGNVNQKVATTPSEPPTQNWVRPSDWIDIDNAQLGNINLLVSDLCMATYAFTCTCSGGQYQIDWGDGTITQHNTGVKAQHSYTVGSGQPCSRGYTTFKIVISPVSGNLTTFKVDSHSLAIQNQTSGVLDCICRAINLTTMSSCFYKSTNPLVYCRYLERFKMVDTAPIISSISNMFNGASGLYEVDISGITSFSDATTCFNNCTYLKNVKLYNNLSTLSNAQYMFNGCTVLEKVDISGLINLTNTNYMFSACTILNNFGTLNLAKVTTSNYMFQNCRNITSININMPKLTSGVYMFTGCAKLENVIIENLDLLTNASYMFSYCTALEKIDINNMRVVTDVNNLFNGCNRLQEVTLNNITTINNATNMFYGCYNLYSVDLSNMSKLQITIGMFYNCYSLENVNLNSMVIVSSAGNMFYNCYSLKEVQAVDFAKNYSSSTSAAGIFQNCEQLTTINMPNTKFSAIAAKGASGKLGKLESLIISPLSSFSGTAPQIDISYNTLTAEQINTIFTSLPTVTGKNITVYGCTGAATCDKTIVTAKGWTVTS